MKKFYIGLMTLVILLVVSVGMVAWADVPDKMSFEGRLTDTSDNPITTSTTLQFGIHSAASGGTQVWTSGSYTVTPDTNGVFHVVLGSQSDAINPDIFDAPVRYIEVIVEGERLTPRAEIVSVGYAFKADDAQTLMGNTVAQIISM
ncbi:MAG: hypothetical protein KKB81_06375, partial [Candidatus Margulisbacteria bacterium]|nr:hypothetical protein [Candidatus Margulisiibacteriota bacterium]MBU1022611.1 hypothetical protein [Candidatus Margulisiibacteriota bacterium]MBU1955025.1 hypothetical protein [Candidatus Margulisiibacteriota bacterium]